MFKLVKISPIGKRSELSASFDPEGLINLGELFSRSHPGEQYGVADECGFFVWPERWANAHIGPKAYHPLVKEEYL